MFGMSWHEMMIVGVIAILLFGKRLPEVAKSLGNTYREFKRGLSDFHSQVDPQPARAPTIGTRTTTRKRPRPASTRRPASRRARERVVGLIG
jgi:sec-independent protein translocase protein TatA